MDRPFRLIKFLLVAGLAISCAALARDIAGLCEACVVRTSVSLPLLGACAYGLLAAGAFLLGPTPALFGGILAVATVHGVLVGHMVSTGAFCALCLLAAGNAAGLFALTLACDTSNFARAALVVPVTAAAAMMALFIAVGARVADRLPRIPEVEPAGGSPPGQVSLVIFEKPDCPYCVRLREEHIPRLAVEFGDRVRVAYRPASDWPGVTHTPTLLVIPHDGTDRQIIEGLPPYEMLRSAVERALGRRGP